MPYVGPRALARARTLLVALAVALGAALLAGPATASATSFFVNTTGDGPGDGVCDTTECTLREAIVAANADTTNNVDHIMFSGPAFHAATAKAKRG